MDTDGDGSELGWTQIQFTVLRDQVDWLTDLLEFSGAMSVSMMPANEERIFESYSTHQPQWNHQSVSALFSGQKGGYAALIDLCRKASLSLRIPPRVSFIEEQDWVENFRTHFQPHAVTSGLWICPSWAEAPEVEGTLIYIDPGMAFGTGAHATTRMCLRWIEQQAMAGKRVVDYGCGSGIVAIGALLKGCATALGVDIDPRAVTISRENAERNGVFSRYQASLPDTSLPMHSADVLIANILADALIELSPVLTSLLHPSGCLVLSGVLEQQGEAVTGAYPDFNFDREEEQGWLLLAGTRKPLAH